MDTGSRKTKRIVNKRDTPKKPTEDKLCEILDEWDQVSGARHVMRDSFEYRWLGLLGCGAAESSAASQPVSSLFRRSYEIVKFVVVESIQLRKPPTSNSMNLCRRFQFAFVSFADRFVPI